MSGAQTQGRADSIGRFIAGDPLRALAATFVIAYHGLLFVSGSYANHTLAYGSAGQQFIVNSAAVIFIFFVGSGYLIGRPYVRAFVLGRPSPRLGNYARNRLARILPVCWVAVTVTLLVRGIGDSSPGEVAAIYALMQNAVPSEAQNHVIHIWSVDAEAIFYILLPIVAVLAGRLARDRGDRRSRLAWTFAAVAVAVVFSFLWRARHPVDLAWQRYTAGVLFAIAIGMGLAALEIVAVAWARGLRRAALIGDGLFVLGWVVLLGLSGQGDAGAPLRTILSAIACALVMGGPLLRQWAGAGCSPWLDNRVMHAIGRWSYSIFLFHLVVLQQIASRVHFDSAWGTAAVVLPTVYVLAVALGALSFQLIEKPCMRFRGVSSQPTAKPQHEPVNLGAEPSAGSEPLPGVPDPQSA